MTQAEWSQNLTAFMAEWDRKRKAGQDYDYLGDAPFPNFVLTSKAKSWDGCLRWIAGLKGSWYFRGQREAAYGSFVKTSNELQSSRAVSIPTTQANFKEILHAEASIQEDELVDMLR